MAINPNAAPGADAANTANPAPTPQPARRRRIAAALLALTFAAGGVFGVFGVFGVAAVKAHDAPAADAARAASSGLAAASAMDPALQRMFMALATSVLSSFAANPAKGSLDGFDPGPALESTVKTVLASRELHTAIDRLVDQAGRGVEGGAADAVSPEMRALMKAALSGAVSMARNEIARELAGPQAAPVLNP